jgi:DNA-binding XRE family transcriptional regulator
MQTTTRSTKGAKSVGAPDVRTVFRICLNTHDVPGHYTETLGQSDIAFGRLRPDQAEIGKMIDTSDDVVGRYERGDISPSIEVVSKIADALEVSVDYLIGKTRMELDKDTMRRIEDIPALPQEIRTLCSISLTWH